MSGEDGDWSGLWHRHQTRAGLVIRALAYLGVPLALAALFNGERPLVAGVIREYPATFIVTACATGCFDLVYGHLWPRLVRGRPSWTLRIAGHVATLVVCVVVASSAAAQIIEWLWCDAAPRMRAQLRVQIGVVSVVIIAVLATIDEMNARARRLERVADRARVAALRAELAALQARTDPHFLFNCLNTVAALIVDDPPVAEAMLERLAAVFRYALDAGRRAQVALVEEVAAVTAYLEVEALRLGSRLVWRMECDAAVDAGRILVPPLMVQPLAENAILHGAGRRRGATLLLVSIAVRGQDLIVAVEDQPADPAAPEQPTATPSAGAGTALSDLAARLALVYGDRARVAAAFAPPAGWRAEIVLPAEAA